MNGPIPTLGYPSQKAAIFALYELRMMPRDIARQTSTSINVVHRAIHDYKVKTGNSFDPIRPEPVFAPAQTEWPSQTSNVWAREENHRRRLFHMRAVEGARQARMALEGMVQG